MERETLLVLDGGLTHLLSHLLIKVIRAANGLLHTDLAQLLRANTASLNVLTQHIHDVIKT